MSTAQQIRMLPRQETSLEDAAIRRAWRRRLRLLQLIIIIMFTVVTLRLIQIQIVDAKFYQDMARKQGEQVDTLRSTRGALYDRNGVILASTSMDVSVAVNPRHVGKDSIAMAKTMSRITGKSVGKYLALMRKKSGFVYLERRLPPQVIEDYCIDTLRGIDLRVEPRRIYHTENAGQLIGTTNTDNMGIAGLELQYGSSLSGTDGFIVYGLDGLQREKAMVDYPRMDPISGKSLVLTIDLWLQQIAERELEKGIRESEAEGGIVVMMDPRTGEILALAQNPRVSPSSFGESPAEQQKIKAVTDMVEPGSVFKIVTASAALEYNLISPDKTFFAENGVYKIPIGRGKRFRTIKDVHKYGTLTFREAVEFSSNIVMVKASDIIGDEKLYRTARDYGFGMPTNIDLPGETGGRLSKPSSWSGLTRHSLSYGYEVAVTPIQIAAAYAAVANGGTLVKPFLVKRVLDADGNVLAETTPQRIRRVISDETARRLTSFFEGVVERGTGTSAAIEGVRIAGKTGTSKHVVDGSYNGREYTASFVGYLPADDPLLLCLVMLDNPRGINYYGGTTSAPIFRSIVHSVVTTTDRYGKVALPGLEAAVTNVTSPGGKSPARVAAKRTGRKSGTSADKETVHVVPDVCGYSMRKAIGILQDEKFKTEVHGSGVVISQKPVPGAMVSAGMVITLNCQPRYVDADGMK